MCNHLQEHCFIIVIVVILYSCFLICDAYIWRMLEECLMFYAQKIKLRHLFMHTLSDYYHCFSIRMNPAFLYLSNLSLVSCKSYVVPIFVRLFELCSQLACCGDFFFVITFSVTININSVRCSAVIQIYHIQWFLLWWLTFITFWIVF